MREHAFALNTEKVEQEDTWGFRLASLAYLVRSSPVLENKVEAEVVFHPPRVHTGTVHT